METDLSKFVQVVGKVKGIVVTVGEEAGDTVIRLRQNVARLEAQLQAAKEELDATNRSIDPILDEQGVESITLQTSTGQTVRVTRNPSSVVKPTVFARLMPQDKERFVTVHHHVVSDVPGLKAVLGDDYKSYVNVKRRPKGKRVHQVDLARLQSDRPDLQVEQFVTEHPPTYRLRDGDDGDGLPSDLFSSTPYNVDVQ